MRWFTESDEVPVGALVLVAAVAAAYFSGLVPAAVVAAALAGAVTAGLGWVVRTHSYVASMVGYSAAALMGFGPVGLVVAYFSSILNQGWKNQDLTIRVLGVALGLCLPVVGLPLSILLPLYVAVTCRSFWYTAGFAVLAGVLSMLGGPQFVLVLMVGMSLFNREYGESALEVNRSAERSSSQLSEDIFENFQVSKRDKSNIVYGAIMAITPLMGVGVGHSALASKWGLNPTALILIECGMEAYNLKAVLGSVYSMSRTGLGEVLNNTAYAFPTLSWALVLALLVGVIVSLVISYYLGAAPQQLAAERLVAGVSLGVLCAGSLWLFATAVAGSYVLSKLKKDSSGFATLPLMG